MDGNISFETFYSAVEQSFFEKSYQFSDKSLLDELEKDDFFDETAISHTKVMLSSWTEFLTDLFKKGSTENEK